MNSKNIELPENIRQGIEKIVTISFPTIPFEIIFSLEMNSRVTDLPEHRDTQDMLEYFKQVCEKNEFIDLL